MESIGGKTGENVCIFINCGEKTTTYYDRAFVYTPAITKD